MSWTDFRALAGTAGSPGPSARNYHTATLVDTTMYVIGGTNGDQFYQDVHEFDIEAKSWREMDIRQSGSKSAMTARSRHSAVAIGKNVYVFGGVFAGFGKTAGGNEVYILDTTHRRWIKPKASGRIPQPRFAHCAAAIGDRMYIFGGHDGQAALNDLYYFDAAKASWTHPAAPAGTPPPPSHNYAMVAAGEDLYVLGGPAGFDSVYMLKTGRELCWVPVTCAGTRPSPRLQFSCTVVSSPESETDSLYIFGGGSKEGQVFNDTFALDLAVSGPCRWRREPVSGTIPATRIGHTTVFAPTGGKRELFVFGGTDRQTFLSDLFILDLDAVMSFSLVRCSGAPPLQRVGHTATLLNTTTSASVAIIGGDSVSEVRKDLVFLKESGGRWEWSRARVSSEEAVGRVSHTATAVGNRVVVFGGGDLKSCRNDLWIADVNSNTWSWTNQTGKAKGDTPPPRAGHTATYVRDGDQDFVFFIGGFSDREYRADVYRLDITPGRSLRWDICLPSVAGGAAALRGKMMTPRLGHTASLVRERIFIFGGSLRGNAIDNDLYEFNPMGGANSWAKVKVHGEPPCRRFGHTASVIEGVRPRIFVVGGLGAPNRSPELLNDVHVFDVETSTWSTPRVKGTEDFDPRCRHTAIVHKDDILIFGGCIEANRELHLFRLDTSPGKL